MAIDDNPITALRNYLAFEDVSKSSLPRIVANAVLKLKAFLPPATPSVVTFSLDAFGDYFVKDRLERMALLLDTVADEVLRMEAAAPSNPCLSPEELDRIAETARGLLMDGLQKAATTRSKDRVRRIGMILGKGLMAEVTTDKADEIEEMMRTAVDLSDVDITYLRQLIAINGSAVRTKGRISRYDAYSQWERGPWGNLPKPELDSIFSKLESYGLVSRVAQNNTYNIMADVPHRYALLAKGLRFADLASEAAGS